jgi:hypothetical protein
MKNYLLAVTVSLCLTTLSHADQSLWENFTKLIVGEWQGNGTILTEGDGGPLKRGDKFTLRASYRATASGRAILGTQVLTPVDHPENSFDCTVTFGWNPASQSIDVHAYWAEGAVEQIALREQQENDFLGTYTILLPTGKSDRVDVIVKTFGNDKFAWTFASGPDAGTALVTNERVQSASEAEKYLTFWKEYFQGEWDTTVVQGEDTGPNQPGAKGVWNCQLHPTQHSMVFSAIINGSPIYNAVAGYDPKSRAWKEVFFDADGNHLIQYYQASNTELDPNSVGQVIKGRAEYIYADGRIELAEIGVRLISRDRCEYYAVSRQIDGRPATDLLFIFERRHP